MAHASAKSVAASRGLINSRLRAGIVAALIAASTQALAVTSADDLTRLSLEELSNVAVTSVSKSAQPLSEAPAAIFVITRDDIIRSGATSLSEALRLAPNLRTTQMTSSNYTATARGFGGNPGAQNFANKLLVVIDGRSVYTPLFSGLYLDAQDVVLNDIERIEVISGPGATLWGANAMNGVINIITRSAKETTGNLVAVGAGDHEQKITLRQGGSLEDGAAFRVYGKAFQRGALQLDDGSSAHDGWSMGQGGFRLDWVRDANEVTVQGDAYRGKENQLGHDDMVLQGVNLLTNWRHRSERSDIQVKVYFDQTQRGAPPDGVAFVLHTYDLEIQQSLNLGTKHYLVWGAGERINSYGITNSASLLFVPPNRSLTLANLFAQDSISLTDALKLIVGIKFEDDPYYGWSPLPDLRVSWKINDRASLWAAAARAIRSPTPFDTDVVEKIGTPFLIGNPDFRPERVNAYELGYRGQPSADLSVSVNLFYNVYDDLRNIEPASSTSFLPLHWGNGMEGDTYGVDAWATWQVMGTWRLSPGVRILRKNLRFEPGASTLLGVEQAGNDPSQTFLLKSSVNLAPKVTFDATLRYVSELPSPELPSYYEMNVRVGWHVTDSVELSLTGFNLLHARHREYPAPDGEQIERSLFALMRWSF